MVCFGIIVYEDIEACFVDSGSSYHMMGMTFFLFTFTNIDLDYYVGSGNNMRHAMKGVGYVRLQIESGKSSVMV